MIKNIQGTHGFEPWTYRTAADCSTTELYPQVYMSTDKLCHLYFLGSLSKALTSRDLSRQVRTFSIMGSYQSHSQSHSQSQVSL